MANDGNIQGKQKHAEGQQGEKTHEAFLEQIQKGQGDEGQEGVAERGSPFGATPSDGRHRLTEEREQHDEAEKNSELKKLDLPNSHKDRQR